MITVRDPHGVVHAAHAWDKPGHCLCGYPPYGTMLGDPIGRVDFQGRYEVTCPKCLEALKP